LLHAIVHPADIQDRDGGVLVMATLFGMFPFLKTLFADGGYQGPQFAKALAKILPHLDVEIVKRSDRISGFVVLPKRWIRDRLYNVAKLGFEWSFFIERKDCRRQPLLIPVNADQHTSQFVTGDSESSRDLMRQRRPVCGPVADGGAHGPAHGSPSAASARIVRSDKVRPTASDRGLRSSRADGTAHEPATEAQRRATSQSKDGDSGGIGR
jgi:hypothetical protein